MAVVSFYAFLLKVLPSKAASTITWGNRQKHYTSSHNSPKKHDILSGAQRCTHPSPALNPPCMTHQHWAWPTLGTGAAAPEVAPCWTLRLRRSRTRSHRWSATLRTAPARWALKACQCKGVLPIHMGKQNKHYPGKFQMQKMREKHGLDEKVNTAKSLLDL